MSRPQSNTLRLFSGMLLITILLLISFGVLAYRLFDLQISRQPDYVEASRNQQFARVIHQPQRGMIVDCHGRILAASSRVYNLFAEPRRLDNHEQAKTTAAQVQDMLKIPGHEVTKTILEAHNPGFVRIWNNLTLDQRELFSKKHLTGIGIENTWQRTYPAGPSTCHVLGFIGGDDEAGLSGLELQYNSVLSGKKGIETFAVDVRRRPIGASPSQDNPVQDGQSLILTLDATIQQFVRAALTKKVKEYRAESGVGIVMDPWSGAILAMVSWPDFEPDAFGKVVDPNDLRNRAVSDMFEPGSIFKPIVAAVALDSGAINTTQKFDCEDGYWAKFKIGEFGNHRYGMMNVCEILCESSNVGMAKIGLEMRPQQFYDGLKLFGFGKETGVDLPGEVTGLVYPPGKWSKYSPTRIAFGHEVLVTAVQMARAYCILANGGSLIHPHLVKAVVNSRGEITDFTPAVNGTGYVIKPEIAHWIVRKALTDVVNEGTGDQAAIEGIQVFGKTGTANIALPTGGYDTKNYVASFAGGAPADHPRVVVLVSIRRPDRSLGKGYSGGRVAAPVMKEILEKTLTYLDSK